MLVNNLLMITEIKTMFLMHIPIPTLMRKQIMHMLMITMIGPCEGGLM